MADELLGEFLSESWENLTQLDIDIVELERDPKNPELIGRIFRSIHTIKGSCGFVGLPRLEAVAHSAENVLGRMRDAELEVSPTAISLVLEGVDRIKELLTAIESTGEEPDLNDGRLIKKLDLLASLPDTFGSATGAAPTPVPEAAEETPPELEVVEAPEPVAVEAPSPAAEAPAADPVPAAPEPRAQPESEPPPSTEPRSGVTDLSIRVNVDVLDSLMNLVGELVLTRNQLLQLVRGDEESQYSTPIALLNRVTTDLQEGVMKTRMQPIGNAWNKLPRLVRDLTQVTGKPIELEMQGAETELDRTVLDAIKDPLTHMVRNSADHGLESPEDRRALGKPESGRIRLNAWHEGGHVIIQIEDDGRGIDLARVRDKAVERGLLSEADVTRLPDHEVLQLIFRPGFSTAEKVSSVSGRGVGMDVVRTRIESIGGTVDMSSREGVGTTIRVKLPLTLAIISAVVVESGGECFAIPQLGIVELVRLADEDRSRIERIHDRPVFRLRDRLLPLVHLNEVLGLESDEDEESDVNIVVVQVGDEQFGLVVSDVFDTEEIVVKPVGRLLKDIGLYQGTTILGDGRVIMILDVAGIASRSGGATQSGQDSVHQHDADGATGDATTTLLVFDPGNGTNMAVPLGLVARLEEIATDTIEWAGDMRVVQYRGSLLPLLPVEGIHDMEDHDVQPVVVFTDGANSMGLLVREIRDIVDERLVMGMSSQRIGVAGTSVVGGRATDIVDTGHYVVRANPEWFLSAHGSARSVNVLVVDPSRFLRELAAASLRAEGWKVQLAEDLDSAREIVDGAAGGFDVVAIDLDSRSGRDAEAVAAIAAQPNGGRAEVVGLASRPDGPAAKLAHGFGVETVLRKFDPAELVEIVNQTVASAESAQEFEEALR